jgi:predicted Zn-dependent protease
MTEIEILERRVAENAEDAKSIYQLAVLLEDQRTSDFHSGHTRHEEAIARLTSGDIELDALTSKALSRIRTLLTRVISLQPGHARAHAQLGHTLVTLGDHEQALAMFRISRTLDPGRACVDVYVAEMLATLERDAEFTTEIEALAKRQKVSLKAHRAEIAKTGWKETPDLLMQAFIRAGNFLASEIADEAERIRNSLVKGRKKKLAKLEMDDCAARQKQLRKEFRTAKVPKALRSLAAAASKYGIGDDVCRPMIMKKVPKAARARLIKAVDKLAPKVEVWLDSFGGGDKMTVEAAAYMYLYEAIEEIR